VRSIREGNTRSINQVPHAQNGHHLHAAIRRMTSDDPGLHKAATITLYLVHRSDQDVWTYMLRPCIRSKELSGGNLLLLPSIYVPPATGLSPPSLEPPIPLPRGSRRMDVEALPNLPPQARIQAVLFPDNGTTTVQSLCTVSCDATYDLLLWSGIEESSYRSIVDRILAVHAEYNS